MKNDIITGLDIGSSNIRLVVAQRVKNATNNLQIIGVAETESQGISKGRINSIEEATSSITACLDKAERLIGVPIDSALVGVSGAYIKSQRSKGVVAVSRPDGEIQRTDVDRAIEASQALTVPPNYEILHSIPIVFTVDNQGGIKNPIGMSGVRLEVETLVITGLSSQITNLSKAVYRTKLEVQDLVLSILASAETLLTPKQKDLGGAIINIGGANTSLAVFEEGEVLHTAILPIGSEYITSDIALGLRCPLNVAEQIKVQFGTALPDKVDRKREISINDLNLIEEKFDSEQAESFNLRYVASIIEARVEEIFEKIDEELGKVERSGMLPTGVFLIGGGAKLPGIIEVARRKLRLPAALGKSSNIDITIEKAEDLAFLPALALAKWGANLGDDDDDLNLSKFKKGFGKIGKAVNNAKDWFKSLIP